MALFSFVFCNKFLFSITGSKHYMTIMAPSYNQNLYLVGHDINNIGKGLPGLQNYEVSFPYKCVGVETIIFKDYKP